MGRFRRAERVDMTNDERLAANGIYELDDNGNRIIPKKPKASATAGLNGAPEVTEDGIARLFTKRHGAELRYDHDAGHWFKWTGDRWQRETTGLAYSFCRDLAREASDGASGRDLATARRASFAGGVERMARTDRAHAVTQAIWDTDPMLLGVPGGVVDLRTGIMRPPDPEDYITRQAAVSPAPEPSCSRWLAFLEEATGGDAEMIRFLQQWTGYSLTGETIEHALAFVHGPGKNGKGVFLDTVAWIMADYAVTAGMDTFTASRSDRHPTDLAMLKGARLVTASETEEGRAWAESRIKQMTGGDPITARFMRQDFFTYQPQFKLTIVGNHRPVLHNVDDAARRRFNIVPFTRTPKKPDLRLREHLVAEWPGILRWMIEGCLDWRKNGLVRPAVVIAETDAYFDAQDTFGQWLEEECEVEVGNLHRWETAGRLFAAWGPGTQRAFGDRLGARGFSKGKHTLQDAGEQVRRKPTPPLGDANPFADTDVSAPDAGERADTHTENGSEPSDEPDPELVELMRERVVRRKSTAPKNPKPGPGRPKGMGKVPGSGKRAGRPNLMSPEFRAWLSKRAKPFELLAKICRGDEIMDGNEKRRPTVAERMRAAETLTRKIIPDLQATKAEVSGPDGAPLVGAEMSDFEAARRIAFALTKGLMEQEASAPPALGAHQRVAGEAQGAGGQAVSVEPPAPPVGHEEQAGSYTLRLVDRMPGGRERWVAHDQNGKLAATAFGRDRLLAHLVKGD